MASPAARLGSAFYYGAASLTVQFVIKTLITTYQFNFPMCIALSQMMFMCPVCYLVAKPGFEWKTAQSILPLAAINVMNLVSGLIGTGGLNVPMFIALRRFTLLLTVLLELFWFGKRHSQTTYFAVGIMILGALIAALTDLTFNLRGYIAVFTNNLFTAAYLVMIKNVKTAKELTTTGLLFYNSMLSIPLLLVAVLLSGELLTLQDYPRLDELPLRTLVVASSVLGMTINHAQFLCTRLNEPIMTSVAGQLKNMVSTVAGALLFGDFVFSIVNVAGLVVSMTGSVIYAAHSALRRPKADNLPVKSSPDGYVGDKLKNYTPLSTKVDGGSVATGGVKSEPLLERKQ
ncbi:hypothetical protein BSKO_02034 [Bryopsis sp. KO-2023]|nr:hypothetical protein BSKO_02034 [Bryopsis sp. KO-2023]